MSLTITITPVLIGALIYGLVGFGLLCAGIMERMSFVNPRYWEVVVIAVIWPIWILQIPYNMVTGRYIVNDVKQLRRKL